MAERSKGGSRWETGCGTAPTAQAANMLSTNPVELGRPIVTVRALRHSAGLKQRSQPLNPLHEPGAGQRNASARQRGPVRVNFSQLPENRQKSIPADVAHIRLLPGAAVALRPYRPVPSHHVRRAVPGPAAAAAPGSHRTEEPAQGIPTRVPDSALPRTAPPLTAPAGPSDRSRAHRASCRARAVHAIRLRAAAGSSDRTRVSSTPRDAPSAEAAVYPEDQRPDPSRSGPTRSGRQGGGRMAWLPSRWRATAVD